MKMYRGDLLPPLIISCTDDGAPVDLTTALAVRVIGVRGSTIVFDRTVTGAADGTVTMQWQPGDTDTTGRISVEAEVMWPGNLPQTFRPNSAVDIYADLG